MDSITTTETTQDSTEATAPKAKRARRRRGRRLNGEGTIYQRADGRWCAEVSTGNGRRKSLYGKTAEDVRAKLSTTIEGIAKGQTAGDDRMTVATFLDRFLDERRARTRPQTMQHYENAVRRHIVPHLGTVKLRKLAAADVQRFLEKKRAEVLRTDEDGTAHRMSPMMVRHIRTVLKMAMRLAVEWDLVVRNVVDGVRGPKLERQKIDTLDADETRKLLATTATHPLGAIWLIAAMLGLRRGEILGLRWLDIDVERSMLSVRVQLVHLDDETDKTKPKVPHLVEPKSKSAMRDIRMPPQLVAALQTRKATQAAQRLKLGTAWGDDMGLVFTTQDGRPLVGGAVSSTHAHLCDKAKVRRVRFHDLRHGAATMMLGAGVDLRTLSETLGHARASFTLEVYAGTKRPRLDDAVDKLAAVLLP